MCRGIFACGNVSLRERGPHALCFGGGHTPCMYIIPPSPLVRLRVDLRLAVGAVILVRSCFLCFLHNPLGPVCSDQKAVIATFASVYHQ